MLYNKLEVSPLLNVLKGFKTKQVPIWIMRQAGRYLPEYRKIREKENTFLDLCYNPKRAAEVSLLPLKRFDLDACIVFSDILVIPDALGQKVRFVENIGPILEKITSTNQLKKTLSKKDEKFSKTLKPVYETLAILKETIPKNIALIGFSGAPWTIATYMIQGRGRQNLKALQVWDTQNRDFFTALLDILVDAISEHLIKQVDAGADVLQIFDSWAGALEEENISPWAIKPVSQIVNNVRKVYPSIPIIGFPKGMGKKILEYIKQINVDAVSIDHYADLQWVKNAIQPFCAIQGCLSPDTLCTGKNLKQETLDILETFSNGSHIFNLGHGINKNTPIKNVEQLVHLVKNFTREAQ